jgi:putative peptide zinc metalloprotease protein
MTPQLQQVPQKAAAPAGPRLPRIRQDLKLYPGPQHRDGSPSWRILDPVRNRFFEIGWLEFQLLSHWSETISAADLLNRVPDDAPVSPTLDEVGDFVQFLTDNQLIVPDTQEALGQLRKSWRAVSKPWYEEIFHKYLFFRVPLFRPDRFLDATLPLTAVFYSRAFAAIVLVVLMADLYLVTRQLDEVRRTFSYFFNLEGGVYFLIAATFSKVIHELGHAYTAKRYGVRVPAMGIAFLVMWPVLYTDTSETWKLADKNKQFAIASAGIVSELVLACFATLLWVLTPDGAMKNIFFILASTTWLITLALNASPFMRFDGYFLLSDALDFPNLHERSSACARWWIRWRFFNLRQEVPEPTFSAGQRRALVTFALVTWFYRLVVFLGIALLVYHTFYKPLGVVLMLLEIWWFVLKPVVKEARFLLSQKGAIRLAWDAIAIAAVVLFALVWAVPITSQVSAPAVLIAEREQPVYAPAPARVVEVAVRPLQQVREGDVLIRMESPDLDLRAAQARSRLEVAKTEYLRGVATSRSQEQSEVLASQVYEAAAALKAVEEEQAKLEVRARISGIVRDLHNDMFVGRWINPREAMMRIVASETSLIEAYLNDTQVRSVEPGQQVRFYPAVAGIPVVRGEVVSVDETGVKQMSRPLLLTSHGGDIQAVTDRHGVATAKDAMYRVVIRPEQEGLHATSVFRGTVRIYTDLVVVFENFFFRTLSIFIRESGI